MVAIETVFLKSLKLLLLCPFREGSSASDLEENYHHCTILENQIGAFGERKALWSPPGQIEKGFSKQEEKRKRCGISKSRRHSSFLLRQDLSWTWNLPRRQGLLASQISLSLHPQHCNP